MNMKISLFLLCCIAFMNLKSMIEKNDLSEKLMSFKIKLVKIKNELSPINLQHPSGFKRLTDVSYDRIKVSDSSNERLQKKLRDVLKNDDLTIGSQIGFVVLESPTLLRGNRKKLTLEDYAITENNINNAIDINIKNDLVQQLKDEAKILTGQYKIHLMPKNEEDILIIIENLLDSLKKNTDFANSVSSLKFRVGVNFSGSKEEIAKRLSNPPSKRNPEGTGILPIIVIYPADGQNNAQTVLDYVYKLFKNIPGIGITPRFNEKITSLIYYAQGDADYKIPPSAAKYYTVDKKFYNPDFEGEGQNKDYSLKNPAHA